VKSNDIRFRILVAALLPLTLMAIVLSVLFVVTRLADVQQAHAQQARSLARQAASASEYGLFSGNSDSLNNVLAGVLSEPGVLAVAVIDARGSFVATSGKLPGPLSAVRAQETWQTTDDGNSDILTQPILPARLELHEQFELGMETVRPQQLGQVILVLSRAEVQRRSRDIVLAGVLTTFVALALGGFLSFRLSRSVTHPVLQVSRMVERLGQGDLQARLDTVEGETLQHLKSGLNNMAERLATVRAELEHQVAQATAELSARVHDAEIAAQDKTRFLAAASHDLRQPTHALGLFVARLAQLPLSSEAKSLVNYLDASVLAMQNLLDGLMDVSRLESGTVRLNETAFALEAVFQPIRDAWASEAEERGLRLRVRHSALWVRSDDVLLKRILFNLVGNALRYTPQGSVLVAARLCDQGRSVRLEVRDSGVGIAAEHHEMIFREFYQVGNVERDRTKGLGLGLNIVERTSRLLGHRLSFRSSPGSGSCFMLELPLAQPPALVDSVKTLSGSDPAQLGLQMPGTLDGLTVLVVEDDDLSRAGLLGLLGSWGCTVLEARTYAQAVEQFGRCGQDVDVVLSDFRLPEGGDGLDLLGQFRGQAQGVLRAALMSGDTAPHLMQRARLAGVPLLHKPVRPAKLRSLLRHLSSADWDVSAQTRQD
jgi:signal transduction histidine kinase